MNGVNTRIIREGNRQIVEIPKEFGVPDAEVTIQQDGEALIIRPKAGKKLTLKELFDSWEPLTEEEWPDITDDDLGPLRDVDP